MSCPYLRGAAPSIYFVKMHIVRAPLKSRAA